MFRLCFYASLVIFMSAFAAPAQEVPFKVEKGYVLISGKINGDLPFEAAVATGNAYSYYNEGSLKKLRLIETSSNEILGSVLTRDNAVSLVYAPLTIANQKPVEIRMLTRHDAFDAMSRALGRKIDFILGADYFLGRIVQVDFRSHLIRFLDKPGLEYKPGTSLWPNGGVMVVSRMSGNIQSVFGTMLSLPVAEDVTINGNKVPSLLNTGVVAPVTAPPSAAKGAAATIKVAFGDYEMTDVPLRLNDRKDEYDKSYNAIIGLGLLQNFIITFDWKNKWIVLEK